MIVFHSLFFRPRDSLSLSTGSCTWYSSRVRESYYQYSRVLPLRELGLTSRVRQIVGLKLNIDCTNYKSVG